MYETSIIIHIVHTIYSSLYEATIFMEHNMPQTCPITPSIPHFQVDCTLFGLLGLIMVDMPHPEKEVFENEGANLLRFLDRLKARAWPDWDQVVHSGTFF